MVCIIRSYQILCTLVLRKKNTRGCKQMKDNTKVNLMIYIDANGDKINIAVV